VDDGQIVRGETADERAIVGVRAGRDDVWPAAGDDVVVRDDVAVRVEDDARAEPSGALDLDDGRRELVHDGRDRALEGERSRRGLEVCVTRLRRAG
jgi:hypothetical protein